MTSPRKDALEPLLRLMRPQPQRPGGDEELRLIIETCPDYLCTTDIEGRFRFCNAAFETGLGYDPQSLIGRQSLELIHPDDVARVIEAVRTNPAMATVEFRFLHADGHWAYVEMNRRLVTDDKGNPRGAVVVSRDITDRRKAEERFRLLADNSPIGIYIAQGRKMVYLNPRFLQFTGYDEDELLDTDPLHLVIPEDRAHVRETAVRMLKAGHPFEYEYRIHNKAGEVRWIMESVVSIEYHDGRATLGNYIDITERKRADDAQKQTLGELERSNQELAQFAYVASHDLQEPLRMVASFTQLLSRRYKGQLDDDADEFIRFAVDGVTRMQSLINDLLAYSRVGTRNNAMEPTDVNFLIERVCIDLAPAIEESGATVTSTGLPTLDVDPTQFGQLLQNLVANAIKYRSPGRAPEVSVTAVREETAWRFTVKDNGIGIDPDYFDRIFIIFQRLHGKEDYEGTGIGLAICKKIVERHGGRIWVESEPHTGSAFHFTVPDKEEDTL
ncbi:MAG: PAS domain S-box protein [Dehalococcoidia bacterium]